MNNGVVVVVIAIMSGPKMRPQMMNQFAKTVVAELVMTEVYSQQTVHES